MKTYCLRIRMLCAFTAFKAVAFKYMDYTTVRRTTVWYFIYLQTFGSGHIKSTLSPNPQQKEFQIHSVTCQGNRSIYLLMIVTLIKTYLNMCIFFCNLLAENVGSARAACRGHIKWFWLWGRWESSIILIFSSQKGPSLLLITSLQSLTADSRFLISFYPHPKRTTWPWK